MPPPNVFIINDLPLFAADMGWILCMYCSGMSAGWWRSVCRSCFWDFCRWSTAFWRRKHPACRMFFWYCRHWFLSDVWFWCFVFWCFWRWSGGFAWWWRLFCRIFPWDVCRRFDIASLSGRPVWQNWLWRSCLLLKLSLAGVFHTAGFYEAANM